MATTGGALAELAAHTCRPAGASVARTALQCKARRGSGAHQIGGLAMQTRVDGGVERASLGQ